MNQAEVTANLKASKGLVMRKFYMSNESNMAGHGSSCSQNTIVKKLSFQERRVFVWGRSAYFSPGAAEYAGIECKF